MKLCHFVDAMFAVKTSKVLGFLMKHYPGSVITELKLEGYAFDNGFGVVVPGGDCSMQEIGCGCNGEFNTGPSGPERVGGPIGAKTGAEKGTTVR